MFQNRIVEYMEKEAIESGANKISVTGLCIINPRFFKPGVAKALGYSFEKVNAQEAIFQKVLRGE